MFGADEDARDVAFAHKHAYLLTFKDGPLIVRMWRNYYCLQERAPPEISFLGDPIRSKSERRER